jgi:hypothetical protein
MTNEIEHHKIGFSVRIQQLENRTREYLSGCSTRYEYTGETHLFARLGGIRVNENTCTK